MSLSAGKKLGRYEIRSQIGAGGMGEVPSARHAAAPPRRAQAVAGEAHGGQGAAPALRAGAVRRLGAEPPEHPHRLRDWCGERHTLHRHRMS